MRKAILSISSVLAISVLVFAAGCGSQSSFSGSMGGSPSPAMVPVTLSVTDTPPTGVTILFFQVSISDGSLLPGNVSLLSASHLIPVNVTQLATETDLLGGANIPAGTYTGLTLSISNPQLTIFNGTSAAIGSCMSNTVCQLTPKMTPTTLTFNSSPFPVTLTANSSLAFKLDIHLDTVIGSDLNVDLAATDGVTLSQLPVPPTAVPAPHVGVLYGTVGSLGTNEFTIGSADGRSFSILVNGGTTYVFPTAVCSVEGFGCLATGQFVKVAVDLEPDGTLLATEVDYIRQANVVAFLGTIVNLSNSGGTTIMNLIVQEESAAPSLSAFSLGILASVTVPGSGVAYAVDSEGFVIPTGYSFASASDLQVGQRVLVAVQGQVTPTADTGNGISSGATPVGTAALTYTTNSIRLEPGAIVGTVAAIDTSSMTFTLDALPYFFPPIPPVNSNGGAPPTPKPVPITVQTTKATIYIDPLATANPVNPVLAVGDFVGVDGWLFATPAGATSTTAVAKFIVFFPPPEPLP